MGKYGLIYIAHNPGDGEHTFRIGKTESDIAGRMAELTASTSNLGTYSSLAHFVVSDVDAAERACHARLYRYRVRDNREFFEVDFNRLLRLVKAQVDPFMAQSQVPEIKEKATEEILLQERIRKQRDRAKEKVEREKAQEEIAKEAATRQFQEWANALKAKVELMEREFAGLPFVRWKMSRAKEPDVSAVCIVQVQLFADTRDQGARLVFRGFLDETSPPGHFPPHFQLPDKAVVITYEKKDHLGTQRYWAVWEDEDDHRVGEVNVWLRLSNKPWRIYVEIHVNAIDYDGYHCAWEDSRCGSKTGLMIDEAVDMLSGILAEYARNPIRSARKVHEEAKIDKKWIHETRGPCVEQESFRTRFLVSGTGG
jgi:T5orf172 domain